MNVGSIGERWQHDPQKILSSFYDVLRSAESVTWFRVDTTAHTDPKWQAMGTMCGLSAEECFAKVVKVWSGLADHRPDGNADKLPDETLEAWAQWRGRTGRFAKVFRELCVKDGIVKGWMELNGKLFERREADTARKAADRLRIVRKDSA